MKGLMRRGFTLNARCNRCIYRLVGLKEVAPNMNTGGGEASVMSMVGEVTAELIGVMDEMINF